MAGFVCSICGQSHEGDLTDYAWSLPDEIWALGPEERQHHLEWSPDIAYLHGRYYLRGVIQVRFLFSEARFGWGVWAEVSEQTLSAYGDVFNSDGSHLPPEPGKLANDLPSLYPPTLGLDVLIQFGPADKRPTFTLMDDCAHPLALEQRAGLTLERYHEILQAIGHT